MAFSSGVKEKHDWGTSQVSDPRRTQDRDRGKQDRPVNRAVSFDTIGGVCGSVQSQDRRSTSCYLTGVGVGFSDEVSWGVWYGSSAG